MASTHNSLVNTGAPAQHDPLVATPPQRQHDAIQSIHEIKVEDAPQHLLHYDSTNNNEEIFRSRAEAGIHINHEVANCVPVLAIPHLHRVLQEKERDGTSSCNSLCPELTEDFSQHNHANVELDGRQHLAKSLHLQSQQKGAATEEDNIIGAPLHQIEAKPPARTKNEVPCKWVRCNLAASYLEYRNLRIRRRKARAAAGAANSMPPGILGLWTALRRLRKLWLFVHEWALVNIDSAGPLAPLVFSLVYAIGAYWYVYSDPFEGLVFKIGYNILLVLWIKDCWSWIRSDWSMQQAYNRRRDNTREYLRQLNFERSRAMNGENRPLVTDEPVLVEK